MDYISKLSDDDLCIVCGLIPLGCFRDYFRENPQKFHKICSISRPEKISLEQTKNLIIRHRNSPFLSNFLNTYIQSMLDIVQKKISEIMDMEDLDVHTALLRVLPESDFCNHIDLYLKLSERYTPEYAELMQVAIKEIEDKSQAAAAKQAVLTQESAKAELSKLENELENATQKLNEQISKKEAQDAAHDILQTEYQILQEVLQKKDLELAELQKRISHADLPSDIPTNEEYPFLSLCRVGEPARNSIVLYRMADIVDGVIQTQRQENYPNRNILYTWDHSKAQNYIGIWNWKTKPNDNPEKSDIIDARLLTSQVPVQIIELSGVGTTDELRENLLHGVNSSPKGDRTLFSFVMDEKYIGLLCNAKDIVVRNGVTKLNSEVLKLPLYEFPERETVTIGGVRFFYRINLGIPKEVFQIKNPLDIVKETVLRRMSIAKLRRHVTNITIREAQNIRTFFGEIPTSDFYQNIADACACSIDVAKGYLDNFIQQAETYLREDDIESQVFESAIEHSSSLLEKCRILNQKSWEEEHAEQLRQAKAKLEQISEKTCQQQHLHDQLSAQKERLIEQQKELKAEIAQQEKLAADVEKQISDRIAVARKNAADFISEMAFVQPGKTELTFPAEQNLFSPGEKLSSEISVLHEVQDAIYQIQDELEEAGVSENCSHEFAAFLYAAYTARTPLLLAGPNGLDIADALSTALSGRTVSILRCESEYSPSVIEQCINDESTTIAILNPLHAGWINNIHELFAKMEGKFIIAIHPFAEDLLIEPRGLYNYMLPVLTELFVEQKATRNFVGGSLHMDFQDYAHAEPQRTVPLEAKLAMPPLVKNRLCQILSDMKVLLEDETNDGDFLFGTVPYAYATGRVEVIREKIQNNPAVFQKSEMKALLLSFLGESE